MSTEERENEKKELEQKKEEEEKQKSLELAASTMYWKFPEDLGRFELIAIAFYKGIYVGQNNKPIKQATKLELLSIIAKEDLSVFSNKTHKHFFKSEVNTIKWVPTFPQEENPFVIQKQARANTKIDIDSFLAKMKVWKEEMEQIRMASADVDVTDAGMSEEEEEELELENTANPFILTATADQTVIQPPKLNLESDSGSAKFPEKPYSTDSLSSDPKNHDDFQTPLASSRFIPKTSTPGVHFAGESEEIPRCETKQTSSLEDPVIQQLMAKISLLEKSQTSAPRSEKTTSLTYKLKLVYDPKTPIEDFLTSVENYGRANGVFDTQKYISVAQAAMSATSEGMELQSNIEAEDLSTWESFKSRCKEITGHSSEFYEDMFINFRIKDRRPGQALAALTLAYKRARLAGSDDLRESDKKLIMDQFVRGLTNPLKGFMKMHLPTLTFRTIGAFAERVSRGFDLDKESVAAISVVQTKTEEEPAANPNAELLNAIKALQGEISKANTNQGRYPRGRSALDAKKMKGFCYNFHGRRNCWKKAECPYSHEKPPADVQQYMDTLFKSA